MIAEHELVVLTKDISGEELKAGDVGTVVHVYSDGLAYEVEFMTLNGSTVAVTTVDVADLRTVTQTDRSHVRVAAFSQ